MLQSGTINIEASDGFQAGEKVDFCQWHGDRESFTTIAEKARKNTRTCRSLSRYDDETLYYFDQFDNMQFIELGDVFLVDSIGNVHIVSVKFIKQNILS